MGQQPSSKSKLVNFTDIINRWLSISMYVTATPVATIYKLYLPYNYFISKINMNIWNLSLIRDHLSYLICSVIIAKRRLFVVSQ